MPPEWGEGEPLEPAEPAQGWRTLKKPMKQTVSFQDFRDAVRDSYSYEAARALFDYLEEYEDGTGADF